jgi:hypothetical protein
LITSVWHFRDSIAIHIFRKSCFRRRRLGLHLGERHGKVCWWPLFAIYAREWFSKVKKREPSACDVVVESRGCCKWQTRLSWVVRATSERRPRRAVSQEPTRSCEWPEWTQIVVSQWPEVDIANRKDNGLRNSWYENRDLKFERAMPGIRPISYF